MENLLHNISFKKFHITYWVLAGTALFISGLTQGPFMVSLTRNIYFTLVGLGLTYLLAKSWQKIPAEKIRNSLLGFLAANYAMGMALVIPINPVTYGQLGLSFDELTWRHLFAGSMNFGLVLLFWGVLYFFFFKGGVKSTPPALRNFGFSGQEFKLEVEKKGQVLLVPAHEISHLKAAADYVEIHLLNGQTYLKRATIQSLQKRLEMEGFIQIHRSIIINQNALTGVEGCSKGSYTLVMNTGARLQTSRRYKPAVETMLKDAGLSPS